MARLKLSRWMHWEDSDTSRRWEDDVICERRKKGGRREWREGENMGVSDGTDINTI